MTVGVMPSEFSLLKASSFLKIKTVAVVASVVRTTLAPSHPQIVVL